MAFFTMKYRVLFHDTMAYGSNHHTTNIKLQNIARETLLFESNVAGAEVWQEQLKDIIMLTREAYSFNMAAVNIGEKVAVLLTYESPSVSSMRLCFRIIKEDGKPVAAGYQTMVLLDKDTGMVVKAPTILTQYLDTTRKNSILEPDMGASFADRLHEGGLRMKEIFSPEIIALGKAVANTPYHSYQPSIRNLIGNEFPLGSGNPPLTRTAHANQTASPTLAAPHQKVFTFPGQGAYSWSILRELYLNFPETVHYFNRANEIAAQFLGLEFLPLVKATTQEAHDQYLAKLPGLDQIGIYLAEVLMAQLLIKSGVKPDLLLGHSFGDLAALATAEVFSIETGIKIVCQRVLALEQIETQGKMAALSCSGSQAHALLSSLPGHSLQISVVNHPKQTVVSGKLDELKRLEDAAVQKGVSMTVLNSNYPFHSNFLAKAVPLFRNFLNSYTFNPPVIPVYFAMEGEQYASDQDLATILATQFIRPLDFSQAAQTLHGAGWTNFIECGCGNIVTRILQKNLGTDSGVVAMATAPFKEGLNNLPAVIEQFGSGNLSESAAQFNHPTTYAAYFNAKKPIHMREATTTQPPVVTSKPPVPTPTVVSTPKPVPAKQPVPVVQKPQEETCPRVPIAVVSLGAVLPGSKDAKEFWQNLNQGVSGVVDMTDTDPHAGHDFVAGGPDANGTVKIIPDKTYTLLNGTVLKFKYNPDLLEGVYSKKEFKRLTKGQKLLALALGECLAGQTFNDAPERIMCILGATADGSLEYDDALFAESVFAHLDQMEAKGTATKAFKKHFTQVAGYEPGAAHQITQHQIYQQVVRKFFNKQVRTFAVDSACSSSLYSINFGIMALRSGAADLILAGGIFAPGPANNSLFAQFRGLTPNQSRPFDQAADGVVFGDGGSVLALRRLPDAMENGEKIIGVIRGMGLSSDGKSPSINVPQSKGQSLAIQRAFENTQIPLDTIQYVEAHATSTPVGDAVEFGSLKAGFENRSSHLPRIELRSLKALIGHTGWVSGVASIVMLLKAFEHATMPAQHHYETPNPKIDLSASPFRISTQPLAWPENSNGLPRRAGINGFGFGGTNAHLILEEYRADYHKKLCERSTFSAIEKEPLAVIGIGSLFPGNIERFSKEPGMAQTFSREKFPLPKKKLLLPDVTDHMDVTQFLLPLAAEQIFTAFPEHWEQFKDDIGVILGLESKTERGKTANEMVFMDKLHRIVSTSSSFTPELKTVLDELAQQIRETRIPSGPYTLPGLMPNVTSGRVCNMFNLKGPNMVIDMGKNSLFQSLISSKDLLLQGDAKIILTGGVNAFTAHPDEAEGALLLALTTQEFARENGFEVLGTLDIDQVPHIAHSNGQSQQAALNYRGAHGATAIKHAVDLLIEDPNPAPIREHNPGQKMTHQLSFATPGAEATTKPVKTAAASTTPAPVAVKATPEKESIGTHAFVQGTPIQHFSPRMFLDPALSPGVAVQHKRILFLTDQPKAWQQLEQSGALEPLTYQVVCPAGATLSHGIPVDLSDEEHIQESLTGLDPSEFELILPVKFMDGRTKKSLLKGDFLSERTLIDLMFSTCRHAYEAIQSGSLSLVSLCLGAMAKDHLLPYTGLVSGFIKSMAREIPQAKISAVNTTETHFLKGLAQVEIELGQAPKVEEITWNKGKRHSFKMVKMDQWAKDDKAFLSKKSVVIATGGGRGVTAVLAEELLRQFGCTVIGLGRTDPHSAPQEILDMDETAFKAFESTFYKSELQKDKTQKIKDLKQRYWKYQAANELYQSIQRMEGMAGTYEYKAVDINDSAAIESLIDSVMKKYGRVDLVVHGAGVQVSKTLPKKSLELFQRIVGTKMSSLAYLYQSLNKRKQKHQVHYHLLTSAFSYLGNDGQPDYGAANEAMNRIAENMNGTKKATWSSLAWLGWAGIGMTRGTEFAALAASRRLRGVTKEEGQQIFHELMSGRPFTANNITMADGEIDWYKPAVALSQKSPSTNGNGNGNGNGNSNGLSKSKVFDRVISIDNAPFVMDHLINEIPTMPGALIISFIAEAVKQFRPDRHITAFEKTRFLRFVRVFENKDNPFRIECTILEESAKGSYIRARVLSDFVHKSGVILQKDIVQTEVFVRMATQLPKAPKIKLESLSGSRKMPDPYVIPGTMVDLKGQFDAMRNIRTGEKHIRANYQLKGSIDPKAGYNYMIPNMVFVDAFWRFGTFNPINKNTLGVYVPEQCDVMKVFFDYADFQTPTLLKELTFYGEKPRPDGDLLNVGPIYAVDGKGKVKLVVESGVCRKFGEVSVKKKLKASAV